MGKHSNLDVMLKPADFAFDIFIISLKDENKNITEEEIRQKIREYADSTGSFDTISFAKAAQVRLFKIVNGN